MYSHRAEGISLRLKSPIYLAMHKIGTEHFRILLVQNAPCSSREELLAIEYDVAQRYKQKGVILYNATVDGRCSEETREKISKSHMGKSISEATRAKMSKSSTKRGNIYHDMKKNRWIFQSYQNGKKKEVEFSCQKVWDCSPRPCAVLARGNVPIEREDDSELIREIRARAEA